MSDEHNGACDDMAPCGNCYEREDLVREVVHAWRHVQVRFEEDPDPLWTALDALARAYADDEGEVIAPR